MTKLSLGKFFCRKGYLGLQLICESQERQIADSSSGLHDLIYKNLGLSRRLWESVICISIFSPSQPLNLSAALSQCKLLVSVCSKYVSKKLKILVQWQSFANGTESSIYVQIVSQNTITSESFIILWGSSPPTPSLGTPCGACHYHSTCTNTPALSIFICPEPRICYIV